MKLGYFGFCLHRHQILSPRWANYSSTSNKLNLGNMVRVLNVAEKNDAAKNISEIMSNGRYQRKEGKSKFNKIYEFEYQLWNQKCQMIMTSVSGHLLNMEFASAYRGWKNCNPVQLFEAPIQIICPDAYKDIKTTLEQQAKHCSKLIIWTDGDREGENIGFEIINVCKSVKPNIQVYRARFSEITRQAISNACNNLSPPDELTNQAVDVRRELDLRIGAAFTRFQTLRLQARFPSSLTQRLISYGSCQFPTMGFVIDRFKEIENFISEPFWKIEVEHKKENLKVSFNWTRHRLFDHLASLSLYSLCIEDPTATVTDVKTKPKSKWRPVPLDTVELEKQGSRKLHLTAKETMSIAEKLYTDGLISYPRTETNIFPKEINLNDLVQLQTQDNIWGDFSTRVLNDGANPRQGTKSDKAHPPIHPIKYNNALTGNHKKVYEFVVRHFLACVSKNAQGMETSISIEIGQEKFNTKGLLILERNYLEVYIYEKWSDKEVPEYNVGETFTPDSIQLVEGATTSPPLLTEADLITLMEKHGIGTDATHAEHIETIKGRDYVGLNNENRFVPGQLGIGLADGYDSMGLEMSKPFMRAGLELDLKEICEGRKDHKDVLNEQINKYKNIFEQAVSQAVKIDSELGKYLGPPDQNLPEEPPTVDFKPVMKCPKCGVGDIVIKQRKNQKGFFMTCLNYPNCKASIWFPEFIEDLVTTDEICQQCPNGPVYKLKFKVNKLGSIEEHIGCFGGCDRTWFDMFDFRPITGPAISSNRVPSPRQTTIPQNNTENSVPRTNPRQTSRNSQVVKCDCNVQAQELTVRKDGPNCGRKFFKCPNQQCGFFKFSDEILQTNVSRQRNQLGSSNISRPNTTLIPNCECGVQAKQLTVRKEGPNCGRNFFKCDSQQCNFFKFADE